MSDISKEVEQSIYGIMASPGSWRRVWLEFPQAVGSSEADEQQTNKHPSSLI